MKRILKLLFILVFLIVTLNACDKKENKIYFNGGTPPVLAASLSDSIPLSNANKDNQAINLTWSNPAYQFSTGISSQDVTYQLEIDTSGSNFTNPNRQVISYSKSLSASFTQGQLNDYLLNQLQLSTTSNHQLEIRITSYLANSTAKLSSNVLSFTVRPYAIPPKIAPPSSGTLFIVGSAVAVSGWNNPISPDTQIPIQQFTQTSPTLFTITIALVGGGEYKLIAVNGSWDDQWSIATQDDPNEIYGGDFIFNGANVLAPPASGNYKIDVDFQRGKFTVTKL